MGSSGAEARTVRGGYLEMRAGKARKHNWVRAPGALSGTTDVTD